MRRALLISALFLSEQGNGLRSAHRKSPFAITAPLNNLEWFNRCNGPREGSEVSVRKGFRDFLATSQGGENLGQVQSRSARVRAVVARRLLLSANMFLGLVLL